MEEINVKTVSAYYNYRPNRQKALFRLTKKGLYFNMRAAEVLAVDDSPTYVAFKREYGQLYMVLDNQNGFYIRKGKTYKKGNKQYYQYKLNCSALGAFLMQAFAIQKQCVWVEIGEFKEGKWPLILWNNVPKK